MRRLPKIDRILAAEADLQPLFAKARDLRALAGLVDGFLPPDLARLVRAGNLREGELVLYAAHSAAAAKLKLLAPSLCRFLTTQRWQVNSVQVRVQPGRRGASDRAGRVSVAAKTAVLTGKSIEALQALHARLADSPARAALGALLARRGGATGQREAAPRKTGAARGEERKRRT